MDDIRKTAQLFINRNGAVEVRAILNNLQESNNKVIVSGYYNNADDLVNAVESIDQNEDVKGVYISLNKPKTEHVQNLNQPINPDTGKLADKHIDRLTWLLIDLDPERETGTNSTTTELEAARLCCVAVVDALTKEFGFPEPALFMSGNGEHALFPINLPVEDKTLVRDFLKALDQRFSDDAVKVDTTIFNPSRITKLYGTMTRKGPDTPERPQRQSTIESIPDTIIEVTREQLQAVVVALGAPAETLPALSQSVNHRTPMNVEAYCQKAGLEIMGTKVDTGSTIYKLKNCAFDPEHQNNDSSIIQDANGVVRYQCFHNSCQGTSFQDVCRQLNCYPDEWNHQIGVEGTKSAWHLPPAPIDVFPEELQALIHRMVECFGTTYEIVISSILAISSGLIGARRLLQIKQDWRVHASLYLLTVAPTGDSKSPPLNWLMRPVEAKERMLLDEWRGNIKTYADQPAVLKKDDTRPDAQQRLQIKIGDTTVEALIDALDKNPGGLLRFRDEGRSFFTDADKYSGAKGSDQTKFLEMYDLRPVQVDRVTANRVSYVHRPALAQFGGTQPKILVDCFNDLDAAAGYLGRWIAINSDQGDPSLWSETVMSAEDLSLWDSLMNRFISYDMPKNSNGWPMGQVINVTQQAKASFVDYHNELAMMPWTQENIIREIIPKTKEHCLRLCLILHCLEHAIAGTDETTSVLESTMQKAITLTRWVYEHKVRIWNLIMSRQEEPDRQPIEKRVARAIISLESEIKNGALLTSAITDKVNSGCPENFRVSSASVGRICSRRLKLLKPGNHNIRGWVISVATLERLKADFFQETNALTALSESKNKVITTGLPIGNKTLKAHKALSTCTKNKTDSKGQLENYPTLHQLTLPGMETAEPFLPGMGTKERVSQ